MRENIGLYRGKRINNSEWVEGYYEPPIEFDGHKFGMTISYIGNRGWLEDAEIDPETVGECSGIPDKNGKLIFEGDVLKVIYLCQKPVIARVTFRDGKYGIRYTRHGNTCIDTMSGSMSNLYEIIGNIYDNPELLGGDIR